MNKRKLWTLVTVPGLAVTSLLLAFLLLGWHTVGAASDGPAAITDIQSQDAGFIISGTIFAPAGAVSGSGLDVCGDVWVTETVDSEGWKMGGSTSLALEPTYPYTPHISYHAAPSSNPSDDKFLKHAWFNGTTWDSEMVDLGCGSTSLVLMPTYPHTLSIGYDSSTSNGCVSGNRRVKLAWLEDTTWFSRTVPSVDAWNSSLALEPTYPHTPHIVYYYAWNFGSLYHAFLSGTTWVSGTWVNDPVEPSGGSNSLALELTYPYTPHISYYHGVNDDLKHAWLSGTTWFSETVDSAGDVGKYTSLALDSDGNPHISYFDDTNNALKYAWLSGATWFSKTVDNMGEPSYHRGNSSLKLNQSDLPYISYYYAYNDTNGDLKLAHLSGTVWITQTVDSEGDVGQYSSLALNQDQDDCPHISYYDATNGDLKYAYLTAAVDANFTASALPMCGAVPWTVAFTNTSTGDYTDSLWNFGDGATSTLKNPTHTYTAAGVYTVALTVRGPGGTDTETKTVYIKGCVYLPTILKD